MVYLFYLIGGLSVACYGIATLLYYRGFFSLTKKEGSSADTKTNTVFIVGLLFHFLVLLLLGKLNQRYPFATPAEGLLFCAWLLSLIHVGVEILSPKRGSLGLFTSIPITLATLLGMYWVKPLSELPHQYLGSLFSFHIVSSLTAYVCYTIATILATMHLVLSHKLKKKSFDVYFKRLPPLEVLEKNSALWVYLGSLCMLLASYLGWRWVHLNADSPGMQPAEKFIFIIFIVYFGAIVARKFFGVRGAFFSINVLVGFALLLVLQIFSIHGFHF